MSLESVFKLSLIMNMIDNLSGPMAGVASKVGANVSKLDAASQTFGSMAKAGAAMQETGSQIVNAVLAPVEATFETRRHRGCRHHQAEDPQPADLPRQGGCLRTLLRQRYGKR